jgi:dolichyl-phosphate beta-glucosyltransferase
MGSARAQCLGRLPPGATRVTAADGPELGRTQVASTCLVLAIGFEDEIADQDGVRNLIDQPDVQVVLVGPSGDPSISGWAGALAQSRPGACTVVTVAAETSKAEAVRQGMRAAVGRGAEVVGYVSADFSSPVSEIVRLRDVMRSRGAAVVMGARVAMLGVDIRRSAVRHYLGRCFAMVASSILRTAIYDTQCELKLFRPSPALEGALATPFSSTVAFDVELLGRLLVGGPGIPPLGAGEIIEVPLKTWHGHGSSVTGPARALRAVRDLHAIASDLTARRRARNASPNT